jgi:hypothetical protein
MKKYLDLGPDSEACMWQNAKDDWAACGRLGNIYYQEGWDFDIIILFMFRRSFISIQGVLGVIAYMTASGIMVTLLASRVQMLG